MSRLFYTGQNSAVLYIDDSATVALPNGPNSGGQPIAPGFEVSVVDNFQRATANPVTILAPLSGGGSSTQIATSGGKLRFTWSGTFYALG